MSELLHEDFEPAPASPAIPPNEPKETTPAPVRGKDYSMIIFLVIVLVVTIAIFMLINYQKNKAKNG